MLPLMGLQCWNNWNKYPRLRAREQRPRKHFIYLGIHSVSLDQYLTPKLDSLILRNISQLISWCIVKIKRQAELSIILNTNVLSQQS